MLYIQNIKIKNFYHIKNININFDDTNCIIGKNGAGKTLICNVISGLTGIDTAFDLIKDYEFEQIDIKISDGKKIFIGSFKNRFIKRDVVSFKKNFNKRSSFVLTDFGYLDNRYISDISYEISKKYLKIIHENTDVFKNNISYYMKDEFYASYLMGSSTKSVIGMFSRLPEENVPIILDGFGAHHHVSRKQRLTNLIISMPEYQKIVSTHHPEIFNVFDRSGCNIIDLS